MLSIAPAFATEIPYSFGSPTGSCNDEWERINALRVGTPGYDSLNGVNDTLFTGKTLTNIGLTVCGFSAVSGSNKDYNTSDTTQFTVGVFSKTGVLVASFGSFAWNTLNGHVAGMLANGTIVNDINVPSVQLNVVGSHVMQPGELIGISFSDPTHPPVGSGCGVNCNTPSHSVELMCGGACAGNELSNGGVVDFASSTVNSHGFALAGTLSGFGTLAFANWASGINQASLLVGIILILLLVYYIRSEKSKEDSTFILHAALALAIFFVVLQAIGAIIT